MFLLTSGRWQDQFKYRITIQAMTMDLRHDHEMRKSQARLRESMKATLLIQPRPAGDFGVQSENVRNSLRS